MPTVQVRYEQAVYGSFPFWDRGYALLAHSPGCRPEWLSEFRAACQRYGERPAGVTESGGLFALPIARGPWMIVGVGPQGNDDRGRPGALAFHALFVNARDYRRAGAYPFDYAPLLRNDWTAETRDLAPDSLIVETSGGRAHPAHGRAARIAQALVHRKRVALESPGPINTLARQVWRSLPASVRARTSVATWAFGNANHFDLVAMPRLAGVVLDGSYVDPDALNADASTPDRSPRRRWLPPILPYLGIAAVVTGAGFGLVLRETGEKVDTAPSRIAAPQPDRLPPDRSSYADAPDNPEERRRVTEGLVDLADRFGVLDPASDRAPDPIVLMTRLAESVRYRGPMLSARERAELAQSRHSHDQTLALAWDARARRFADNRPLPADFAQGPLRWQLDTLVWSFHIDDPTATQRSCSEVPHALADALTLDVPVRHTPLTSRYPALGSYVEFLGRLPRR